MKDLAFRGLPQQAISEFATSPNPGAPCFAWSSSAGFLKFNGSFWTKNSDGVEEIFVDWIFIGDALVTELVNETSLTIDFSTSLTSTTPVTGEIIWLTASVDVTKSGFYVIGSTASLSAVPITRHPEWPASRYLRKNTKIISTKSPVGRVSGGNFDLTAAQVFPATDALEASFTYINNKDYVVYKLTLDSGATSPGGITPGTYYWAYSDPTTPNSRIYLFTDSGYGAQVNITSVGVDSGGTGKIGILKAIGAINTSTKFELVYIGADVKFQDITFLNFLQNYNEQSYSLGLGNGFAYGSAVALSGVAFDDSVSIGGGFASAYSVALLGGSYAQNSIAIGSNSYINSGFTNTYSSQSIAFGDNVNVTGYTSIGIGAGAKIVNSNALQIVTAKIAIPSASFGNQINGNFHLENRTTNATETRLYAYLNQTSEELVLYDGAYCVSGKVYAVFSSDTTKYTVWKIEGFVEGKGSSTPPVINLKFIPLNSSGDANELSLKIRAAVIGNSFTLYATGIAATNIVWWADLKIEGFDTSATLNVSSPFASGKHTTDYLWLPASETITAGAPVNVWNDSGTVKVRNANASNGRAANGYVTMTYGTGDMVAVFMSGENPVLSGLTIGDIYLGTTAGTYTSSVPGTGNLVQKLGFALTSSNLAFMKEPAIQT